MKTKAKIKQANAAWRKRITAARKAIPENTRMPVRFHDDPLPVKLLLDGAEQMNVRGNGWLRAPVPNPVTANALFQNGYALAASAKWLRAALAGRTSA